MYFLHTKKGKTHFTVCKLEFFSMGRRKHVNFQYGHNELSSDGHDKL